MKKHLQLSLYSAGVSAVAVLLATSAFAANYKGENYKGEAMPVAAVAAPCPLEKALKDGFYVGAQGGYDMYRVAQSFNIATANYTGNGNNTSAANGFAGGLFAGFGQYSSEGYYIGAEALANMTSAQQTASGTNSSGSYNAKVSARSEYGVRVLPGLKVNNSTLFYIPLGYNWARVKGQFSGNSSVGAFSTSKSNTSGGFVYGLGLETAMYENMSIRGEFTHTGYNSFSTQGVKFSPYGNQVMVGLSYHFA